MFAKASRQQEASSNVNAIFPKEDRYSNTLFSLTLNGTPCTHAHLLTGCRASNIDDIDNAWQVTKVPDLVADLVK